MINWKEVYPKMKINQGKILPVLWRCSNTFWKSVNTLRMQQSWRRSFAVLCFGNKIEKLVGFTCKWWREFSPRRKVNYNAFFKTGWSEYDAKPKQRAFTLTILRGKNGDSSDRHHFMDGKNIFRNSLACLCCCWTEETNSDVKITEISKFSSKFTPRRCSKLLLV